MQRRVLVDVLPVHLDHDDFWVAELHHAARAAMPSAASDRVRNRQVASVARQRLSRSPRSGALATTLVKHVLAPMT